jgi:rhodanese-related sulfurtransferase
MSIDELAGVMADTDSVFTVVNVHIPYEGEIEGTDYNVAYNDIDALTTALPDKDAPIILYCRSGNMSEQAAHDLVELGYTQIYDVPGGMNAWQSSGRTLISNQ